MLSLACRAQDPDHLLYFIYYLTEDIVNSSRDTHLYLLHLSCWTILMGLVPVKQVGWTTNGTWNGREALVGSVVLLLISAHRHWEYTFPDPLGSGLIAFELVLAFSAQQCINGIWLFQQLVNVVRRSRL